MVILFGYVLTHDFRGIAKHMRDIACKFFVFIVIVSKNFYMIYKKKGDLYIKVYLVSWFYIVEIETKYKKIV